MHAQRLVVAESNCHRLVTAVHRHEVDVDVDQQIAFRAATIKDQRIFVSGLADLDEHRLGDREGERQADDELAALAFVGLDLQRAAEIEPIRDLTQVAVGEPAGEYRPDRGPDDVARDVVRNVFQ